MVSTVKSNKLYDIANSNAEERIQIKNDGNGKQTLGCLIFDPGKLQCVLREGVQ